eukprot:TRINITY_DN1316_c0_g1_i3.p1 TRINITY_DN1316_c0_g1~~TRINITY_DN1316_c0_g1_i3.p1  ORF type:complete len:277 (-),score=73.83 TRINITY_DN1316_c0_g1_i3:636-1466(-)
MPRNEYKPLTIVGSRRKVFPRSIVEYQYDTSEESSFHSSQSEDDDAMPWVGPILFPSNVLPGKYIERDDEVLKLLDGSHKENGMIESQSKESASEDNYPQEVKVVDTYSVVEVQSVDEHISAHSESSLISSSSLEELSDADILRIEPIVELYTSDSDSVLETGTHIGVNKNQASENIPEISMVLEENVEEPHGVIGYNEPSIVPEDNDMLYKENHISDKNDTAIYEIEESEEYEDAMSVYEEIPMDAMSVYEEIPIENKDSITHEPSEVSKKMLCL